MPAATRRRTTPARKKAKLDVAATRASTSSEPDTPPPPAAAAERSPQDVGEPAQSITAAGSDPSTPSRTKSKRAAAAKASASKPPAQASAATPSEPGTPPPPASPSVFKTPAPRSAKGKAKAKFEDDDEYDDEDGPSSGKTADVEVFTHEGPLSTLNRIQMKTQKPRSLRPLWMQGVYQPPFFGIPPSTLASYVSNREAESQPEEVRKRSIEEALPWPNDGHVKTWLDPAAYPLIKKQLLKFWFGHVGWVPNEGMYDWGWYPGKAFGWTQNIERSRWARGARRQLLLDADAASAVIAQGNRPGWPFIQPWLDTQFQNVAILSSSDAQPFLRDTTTPQRANLRHPTTLMKLTVPEVNMRSRLKQSIVRDPPKTPLKGKRSKTDAGGADGDAGAEDDDEAAASGDADEASIAALDANQVPIDLADPKFAHIPNLGFEEKGPVCGDMLHVSVGPPDQEAPVHIARGTARRLDSLGVTPDEGHLMNAGGHVYAVDWVPVPVHLNTGKEYFAVSAAGSEAPLTMIGAKQPRPAPASLQIWSVAPDTAREGSEGKGTTGKGEARLEMVICHELGAGFKIAWCPIGHDYQDINSDASDKASGRRLGLLAGCFADGSLSVFSVAHPDTLQPNGKRDAQEPVYIRLEPILSLVHPQQSATSLSWAGGELLAFGGAKGWLGVWNVGRILRSPLGPSSTPPPDYVVRAHRSAITDLTFILLPPISSDGVALTSSLPGTLFSVSLDGLTCHTDLRRCAAVSIERSRAVHYCCCFASFSGGGLVHEHADGSVAHYSLRPEEMLRSRTISHTPSRVLALDSSPFHPMLAIGTAHGELKLANTLRTLRRSQRNHLPLYQQLVHRTTGELVLKTHLLAEPANVAEAKQWHVATWHPKLAVTAVKWNANLGRARLVLSGTASGLLVVCEVRPPYE